MYAGFITTKRVVKRAGIHQRFDVAAYRMVQEYLPAGAFPNLKDILHFEGYNGPDGLKSKGGLKYKTKEDHNPSHLYDPVRDTGEVPRHIANHYSALVACLGRGDLIRAAFEASWLAHFIVDGLTPAHHFPLEEKIAEAAAASHGDIGRYRALARKNWAIWGAKGHMTTHMNFELGIAFAMIASPIHPEFDELELARACQIGPVEYFKSEAREVASLDLYERFYREGWNNDIAATVKNQLAPQAARTVGIIWLMAVLEAGRELALITQSETAHAA
jgi:hypothetical protein